MLTCDRCCAPAMFVWRHPNHEPIPACGHHSAEWAPVLRDQGWIIGNPPSPALPPVTADPATH